MMPRMMMINRRRYCSHKEESKNINYLMVNQNRDDLSDPVNSLVYVNPDQDDFGQIKGNRHGAHDREMS